MNPLAPVASLADGACARARRMLDSYLDGELTVETTHEMLEHIALCLACKGESEARQGLKAALRRVAVSGAEPDAALAARIRAEVRRTRPKSPLAPYAVLLAAGLVLAAALAVTRLRPLGPGDRTDPHALHLAAVTQVHCALGFPWPERAPELASLKDDAGELSPVLPDLATRLPGWALVAAHRCLEEGEPVFHVILRREGKTGPESLASLVIVPGRPRGTGGMSVTSEGGFTLVAAAGTRGTAFVVTSGGRDDAMELGRRALPALKPATI